MSSTLPIELLDGLAIGSARGRAKARLELEPLGPLGAEHLELILNPPALASTTQPLLRLRHRHHQLAKLLAEGVSNQEAGLVCGYEPSRISILKKDPAFAELIAYYKAQVDARFIDVHERLAALGLATVEELLARVDEEPEKFNNRELMELVEVCMKYKTAGAKPPGSTSIEINFVGAKPPSGITIDGDVVDV